jgi:hypothetical protein
MASTSRGDSPVRSTASKSERWTTPLTASTRSSGTVSARPTRQLPFAGRAAKESHGLASYRTWVASFREFQVISIVAPP